jgi:hypothetical protein
LLIIRGNRNKFHKLSGQQVSTAGKFLWANMLVEEKEEAEARCCLKQLPARLLIGLTIKRHLIV